MHARTQTIEFKKTLQTMICVPNVATSCNIKTNMRMPFVGNVYDFISQMHVVPFPKSFMLSIWAGLMNYLNFLNYLK